jgi:hypothetical protein
LDRRILLQKQVQTSMKFTIHQRVALTLLRFAPEIEDANTTTGVISGNVFGNDQILCGNVASTQWVFTPQICCPEWCPEIDE